MSDAHETSNPASPTPPPGTVEGLGVPSAEAASANVSDGTVEHGFFHEAREASEREKQRRGEDGHEDSAAPELSGRGVLMTWMISLGLHAVLFFAMLASPWLVSVDKVEAELPVPNAELLGDLEKVEYTGKEIVQFDEVNPLQDAEPTRFEPTKLDAIENAEHMEKPELSIIGIGEGGSESNTFGLSAGQDKGPSFFGLGEKASGARKVVYVVDKSGSMTSTFHLVTEELKESVSGLRRSQKFHVIFFNAGTPPYEENTPRKLVSAIRARKEQLYSYLKGVAPGGATYPAPAMRRAFELKPDLIYFLTDGNFDRDLLHELHRLNKDQKVRIFTIAYASQDGRELLEEIARQHRGEFRFVDPEAILP